MFFEPTWKLLIGERQHQGIGLLHKPLWLIAPAFTLFFVRMNGTEITVLPQEGKILKNRETIMEGASGILVWFRRVQIILGESRKYRYGVGLRIGDEGCGFLLHNDGRLEFGI